MPILSNIDPQLFAIIQILNPKIRADIIMKRILAMHGVGSAAEILKDQLSPLAAELGPEYEFTYLDGAIERERGPGNLGRIYSSP